VAGEGLGGEVGGVACAGRAWRPGWWCEANRASAWADIRSRFPNPDGAGTWAQDGRQVRFLLEYDTVVRDSSLSQRGVSSQPGWLVIVTGS
jgi:hypothetical protein